MPAIRAYLLPHAVLTIAFGLGVTAAPGQTTHLDSQPPANAGASASQQLPDAPSAVQPPKISPFAENALPLEQRPHSEATVSNLPRHIIEDGAHIFVSPAYLRKSDLKWMLPLAGAATASFATDSKTMSEVVSTNPSFNQLNGNISDGLRDGYMAVPVMMYFAGKATHNEHSTETGMLASQAMFEAFVVDEVVKFASLRERPLFDKGKGEFFVPNNVLNSSFVSGHTMIAWSSAAVIANEYPNKWVQIAAYSGATGVCLTRVMAQEHFPTDVLLGAAGGWLIGHFVFRAHHHWSQVHLR
jgi:PAP2 superfamily